MFEVGQMVRLIGTTAIFKVQRTLKDGTVELYGGKAGHFMIRTIRPERLRPLTKPELKRYGSRF